MCQYFVGHVWQPVRLKYPQAYIIHYMDDILIAAQTEKLQKLYNDTSSRLTTAGFVIVLGKIQTTTPASYVGTVVD